jgi:hypothetical protein
MGRKPVGERAMTGAERQRLFRQRHTRPAPRNVQERIVWAVADLLAEWSILLSPEEMAEVFGIFDDDSKVLGHSLLCRWCVEALRRTEDFKQQHPTIANDPWYRLDEELFDVILLATSLRLQEVFPTKDPPAR